ncbi:MAG: beta-galactosidase trimerization domain-containing protein [Clostridia bacterium]|nr:beta-galactosidase trimerization domain-containing protein [Clostridia bacterium]
MAVYGGEYFKGTPAITCNRYGEGKVYYIATVGSQMLYHYLIRQILAQNEIPFISDLPARVEITKRSGCSINAYFIFNNDRTGKDFTLFGEPCHLSPFEMKIIKEKGISAGKA